LVERLFAQIERVLEINGLRTIVKEEVETAPEHPGIDSLSRVPLPHLSVKNDDEKR